MLRQILSGSFNLSNIIVYILSTLVVIFLTLPVHEFAHGYVANKLGDPTPRYQGRLTLNPFAHIDYLGALCIIFFGFGWAKPVQINANNFRNPKRDMAITALAGPVSNIIVALISMLLYNSFYLIYSKTMIGVLVYFCLFFNYVAIINVALAVFNIIPIPPLDGSRLLSALLPDKYYYRLMQYERYIFIGLMALIFFGALDVPLAFLRNAVMNFVSFIAYLPFKFFA